MPLFQALRVHPPNAPFAARWPLIATANKRLARSVTVNVAELPLGWPARARAFEPIGTKARVRNCRED
ncbi:MAG: hypothetical protein U5J78_07780 [Parasphingorhabdus sp.]|nr:hypothetical protein [Parasphingorhabdus sp.]